MTTGKDNWMVLNPVLDDFRSELKKWGVRFQPGYEFRHSPLAFFARPSTSTARGPDSWLQTAAELGLAEEDGEPIEVVSDLMRGRNRFRQDELEPPLPNPDDWEDDLGEIDLDEVF